MICLSVVLTISSIALLALCNLFKIFVDEHIKELINIRTAVSSLSLSIFNSLCTISLFNIVYAV